MQLITKFTTHATEGRRSAAWAIQMDAAAAAAAAGVAACLILQAMEMPHPNPAGHSNSCEQLPGDPTARRAAIQADAML